MVLIAQYDEALKVTGFKADNTFYPLEYQSELEASGHTIDFDAGKLIKAKEVKLAEIDSDFNLAESQTVLVNGITYSGGASSARDIRDYIDFITEEGISTEYNLWDINGTETPLTLTQANEVKIAIAKMASENKFAKKNRKVALELASTLAEVEAV